MWLLDSLDLVQRVRKLWCYLSVWRFKQVFGRDAGKEFHVIYNINIVPKGVVFERPEPKVKRDNYKRTQNLTTVNSCATTRAIGYLVYTFGEMVNIPPTIGSDVETDEKMDMSFISIGGVTNLKTCDVLRDDSNHFLDFDKRSIVHRSSRLPIIEFRSDVAYGLIIKTNPHSNPERAWICCAGFGERGTSGAAWFLATKWKDIGKWAKKGPFAIITKTEVNSDESTVPIHKFRTSEEVEDAARRYSATVATTTTTTTTSRTETTGLSFTDGGTATQ